jgi:hypothetical protein
MLDEHRPVERLRLGQLDLADRRHFTASTVSPSRSPVARTAHHLTLCFLGLSPAKVWSRPGARRNHPETLDFSAVLP